MSGTDIFVGREAELAAFRKVLERPRGEAVVVVGQMGMGKTWLVNRMGRMAEEHPILRCGCVRYEVTPTDSVDSTMALMMDNAFEAAQAGAGSFDGTEQRTKQWKALLNIIKIGDLVFSLKRDPAKNTREQFLKRLRLVSERMPDEGRAVLIIDPEKYMQEASDQAWAIVVKKLPEKIKMVFAQRAEDVLVGSETFGVGGGAVCIPDEKLDVLDERAVDALLDSRVGGMDCSVTEIQKALGRYEGHPYALGAALDLLEAGVGLGELPERAEPVKFAEVQWRKVCQRGDDAIKLFEAHSILEVGVPGEVVEAVSGIDLATYKSLMSDKYLRGLLREECYGKRIYHTILADYVLQEIGDEQKRGYHERAVEVYREKLRKAEESRIKADALAALRLAEHVLAVEGQEGYVDACAFECFGALQMLGLLDVAVSLSERALTFVSPKSGEEGILLGNLGRISMDRGEFDKAEEMYRRALEIHRELGALEGVASQYGNLGLIYRNRGELEKAEEMHWKSVEVNTELGLEEGVAKQYSNLGLVYRKKGDLGKAEQMYLKALEIDQRLGRLEGISKVCSNLGLIYRWRGDLDEAEEMLCKGLKLDERLGRLAGVAAKYGSLAIVYRLRGELEKAEGICQKGLEIDKRLGRVVGVADKCATLGFIYAERGDLDGAEKMHRKSLEIADEVGLVEAKVRQYSALGDVWRMRGELAEAEEMYRRALGGAIETGLQQHVARNYKCLGLIYEARGALGKARECWEKALELYERMGTEHKVKKVEGWIEGMREEK